MADLAVALRAGLEARGWKVHALETPLSSHMPIRREPVATAGNAHAADADWDELPSTIHMCPGAISRAGDRFESQQRSSRWIAGQTVEEKTPNSRPSCRTVKFVP